MSDTTEDQKPGAPEDSLEGWTEGNSKNGKKFHYRAVDSDGKTKPVVTGGIAVNWPPGSSGNTSPEVLAATGVSWYSLQKSYSILYDWVLTVTCTRVGGYLFQTIDDSYPLTVVQTGYDHDLRYNDKNPTIVYVTGPGS